MQIIGTNSKGIATLTTEGRRPVVIEYVDEAAGFFHVRDLETSKPYTIYRTSFTMPTQIPSKYRQSSFERVAAHWGAALNQHPTPLDINPAPLSRLSFMRLLREAREAKNIYGWTHPSIDEELWQEHASQITISETSNGVSMGLKHAKFPPKSALVGEPIAKTLDATDFKWTAFTELEALCLLLDKKAFVPAPAFLVENLTDDLIQSLEARYNVAFVQLENTNKWSLI
jgi:hypothetical protein